MTYYRRLAYSTRELVQGTPVLKSHAGLRSRDRKRAEACAGAKRRRQSRVRRPRRLWACASRVRPYRRPPEAMYDGAAVARRVRVDFERCDPAVRLEESARVRGSRASRTCHYNMFARGGSLSTAQPTVAVLRAHVDDFHAVFDGRRPTDLRNAWDTREHAPDERNRARSPRRVIEPFGEPGPLKRW